MNRKGVVNGDTDSASRVHWGRQYGERHALSERRRHSRSDA